MAMRARLHTRYHHAAAHLVTPRRTSAAVRSRDCCWNARAASSRSTTRTACATSARLRDDPELSPLAPLLHERAEQDHQRRLAAISGGIFSVSNQEEMLELLLVMTREARHTLHAVDRTDLGRWFGNARMQSLSRAQV